MIYPKPDSIYIRGTITLKSHSAIQASALELYVESQGDRQVNDGDNWGFLCGSWGLTAYLLSPPDQ